MPSEAAGYLNDPSPRVRTDVWLLAVCFFGLGDIITTGVGLGTTGVAEVGPATARLVAAHGPSVILVLKPVVLGGAYALWRVIPAPHCVGVPLGLTAVGILVTGWNIHVLMVAHLS